MSEHLNALLQDNNDAINQYLTFILADEEYGVEILQVQEIRSWEKPTRIPNTPPYVLGLINLRGTVVPVIDLRRRFDMEQIEYDESTVLMIAKIKHEKGVRTMGLIVDAVSDVCDILPEQIKPSPDFGGVVGSEYIKGLAHNDTNMIILLDLELLVNEGVIAEA